MPVLEAIVGHLDRETTRIYTHLRANDLVEAVQSLNAESKAIRNKSAAGRSVRKKKEKVRKTKKIPGNFTFPGMNFEASDLTRTGDLLITSREKCLKYL